MNELEKKLAQINKKHVLVELAKNVVIPEKISTGSMHLDLLLDGGWPLGRVVVLYGAYGTAKSTMALWAVANAQQAGHKCLFIDSEKSFEAGWAKNCGVNVEEMPVITTKSLESILVAAQPLIDDVDVIVIDSISSIQSEKYLDEDSGGIAIQARATKELITKLEHWNPNALIICISQLTVVFKGQYAASSYTGGNALKHAASYIVKFWYNNDDVVRVDTQLGDRLITSEFGGMDVHWEIEKARSSVIGSKGKFRFIPGFGNDVRLELFELGVLKGVISKSGPWYYFGDKKWQGRESLIIDLEDAELFQQIKNEIFKES